MKYSDYDKIEEELEKGYKSLASSAKYELPAEPKKVKKERAEFAGAVIIKGVIAVAAVIAVIVGLSIGLNYMNNYQPPAGTAQIGSTDISFNYSIDKTEYKYGDNVFISVTVINSSESAVIPMHKSIPVRVVLIRTLEGFTPDKFDKYPVTYIMPEWEQPDLRPGESTGFTAMITLGGDLPASVGYGVEVIFDNGECTSSVRFENLFSIVKETETQEPPADTAQIGSTDISFNYSIDKTEYKYGETAYISIDLTNSSESAVVLMNNTIPVRVVLIRTLEGFPPDTFDKYPVGCITADWEQPDLLPGDSTGFTAKIKVENDLPASGGYGVEVIFDNGEYTSSIRFENVFSIVKETETQEPFIPSAHSVEECIDRYVGSVKDRTAIYKNLQNERGTETVDYIVNHYFAEADTYKRALMSVLFYEAVKNDGYYNERLIDPFSLWDLIRADSGSGRITSDTMFDHAEKAAAILQGYTELAEEGAKDLQRCQAETDHPLTYKLLCAVGFDGYKPGGPDAAFYARDAIKAAAELFCAVRYGYPPAELYKEPEGNNYVYEIPLEDFYAYFEKYIERDIIDKAVRNSEALQLKDGIIVLTELGPQNGVSVMYRESYLTEQRGDTSVISTPILLPMGMYSWEKEMTFEVKRYGDGYRVSGGTFADLMLSPALDAAYSVSYVLATYLILREGQTEYDSITINPISDLKMSIDDVREEYRSYLREGAVFPVSMLTRIDGEDEWLRKYASDEIFAALRKETDVFDGRYFVYPYYAKTKTTPDFDHGFRIRVDTDYYYDCYMSLYDTLFAMNVIECSKDRVLLSLDFIREENGVKKNVTYTFEVRYGVNDPYTATLTGGTFVTDVILAE